MELSSDCRCLTIAWLLLSMVQVTTGFPDGAPVEACPTMVPLHQNMQPMSTPAPYVVKVEKVSIVPGQTITVSLETLPQTFRYFQGFLIVAVAANNFLVKLGSFATKEEKYVPCGSNPYSAVTHSSRRKKTTINLKWTAPSDYHGPVMFVVTFVENFSTFWVGQQSAVVTVAPTPVLHIPPVVSSESVIQYEIGNTEKPSKAAESIIEENTNLNDIKTSNIYESCDVTKGCYGEPAGCVQKKSCEILVSFRRDNNNIHFEMLGPPTGWIAVGLSKDNKMGDDSVIECVLNKKNGLVNVFTSFNMPGYRNQRLELPQEGLGNLVGQEIDNKIFCSFTRQGIMAVQGIQYDLLHDGHYLFLASGLIQPNTQNQLQQHISIPYRSESPVMLTSASSISGSNNVLIFAHGCLMVVAWIGTASVAVFLARFYKYTWTETTHCAEKVWFAWHRSLNILTLILTTMAIIFIFAYVQGWSTVSKENAHPILGLITFILMWIQPIMAFFRPHPGTPNRPYFNWLHFLVGNTARLLAVSSLFLAQTLQKAALFMSFSGVLVAYVVFEFFTLFIMEAYSCFKARDSRDQIPLKEMPPPNIPEGQQQKSKDAPGSRFRKMALIIYVGGLMILIFTLLLIILMSSIRYQGTS